MLNDKNLSRELDEVSFEYDMSIRQDLWEDTERFLVAPSPIPTSSPPHLRPTEASVVSRDGKIHGSCLLKSWDRLKSLTPAQRRVYSELIFMMGKKAEEGIGEIWNKMGLFRGSSLKFYNKKFNLSGELDRVHIDPKNGKLYGVEIKTAYGYDAKKTIIGSSKQVGVPRMQNLLQALVYLNEFEEYLDRFELVYMFRDNPDDKTTFRIFRRQLSDRDYYPLVFKKQDYGWIFIKNMLPLFSMSDIYKRYTLLTQHLVEDIAPNPEYQLKYSNEKVEEMYQHGEITKNKYTNWKAGRAFVGDHECRYCHRIYKCYPELSPASEISDED